jgi:hypothetical protein
VILPLKPGARESGDEEERRTYHVPIVIGDIADPRDVAGNKKRLETVLDDHVEGRMKILANWLRFAARCK